MTSEREIDYEALAQSALRGVVRTVLGRVAKTGLPGDHHFYIAFRTAAPGVLLSKRLMQKYPEEMTVVLQHRFWNLIVTNDRFEVKLTFDGIEERLSIPFAAIKVFFDPSVPYGLQFEDDEAAGSPDRQARERTAAVSLGRGGEVGAERRTDKRPRALRRPAADRAPERANGERQEPSAATVAPAKRAEAVPAANDAKVVKLDTFRKK